MKYWESSLFNKNSKVKLYKLHGSISWITFYSDSFPGFRVGEIEPNRDIYHTKDPNGELQWPTEVPRILIGTANKILEYSRGIISELFCRFHFHLKDINTLIIIGYGFKDKGINSKIIEYMFYSNKNKIIVIDIKSKKQILENSRPAITRNFEVWTSDERVFFIQRDLKNISWNDIESYII